jgi:hypothetical protein
VGGQSGLERVVANAHRLYARTRPAASAESHTRARAMAVPGPHPWLGRGRLPSQCFARSRGRTCTRLSVCVSACKPLLTLVGAYGLCVRLYASDSISIVHLLHTGEAERLAMLVSLRSFRPADVRPLFLHINTEAK